MPYIILGVGVGCWMYAFVNYRWNENPWIGSKPFFWIGFVAVVIAIFLMLR